MTEVKRRIRVQRVTTPIYLMKIVRELTVINVGGELVKVVPDELVIKEALTRGLRMMLMEHRMLLIQAKQIDKRIVIGEKPITSMEAAPCS